MHEMWDLHTHFKPQNQKYVGDVALVREVMHSPYLQLHKNPLCCDVYPLYWERKRGLQPGTPVEGNCVHFGASSHCWGRRVVSVLGLNPLSFFLAQTFLLREVFRKLFLFTPAEDPAPSLEGSCCQHSADARCWLLLGKGGGERERWVRFWGKPPTFTFTRVILITLSHSC